MIASRAGLASSVALVAALILSGCGGTSDTSPASQPEAVRVAGRIVTVADTIVPTTLDASGVAEPLQSAMLSTRLMGTVTAVTVHEGDLVQRGQVLVRIDARELTARASQVSAMIADAEAMHADAATQAARMRNLYADSAATRAQYDAAITGLTRAEAGVRAAKASAGEVAAMQSYAELRAPFAGVVTSRLADPGAFAAPGAPLITVQDASVLRIAVSAAAEGVRGVRRGQSVAARVDGAPVTATVEGVVPGGAGNLFTVNATVSNPGNRFRSGSAAALLLPMGSQTVVLIPTNAIVREGDLTGVIVHGTTRDERRWVRLGATRGTRTEIASGLHAGESIVIPAAGR